MNSETIRRYLGLFTKLYPSRPQLEAFEIYERALHDISDIDGSAACEICLRELKYFPMPAEIRERVKKPESFISTAAKLEDHVWSTEEKAAFDRDMQAVAAKLGIRHIAKEKAL